MFFSSGLDLPTGKTSPSLSFRKSLHGDQTVVHPPLLQHLQHIQINLQSNTSKLKYIHSQIHSHLHQNKIHTKIIHYNKSLSKLDDHLAQV